MKRGGRSSRGGRLVVNRARLEEPGANNAVVVAGIGGRIGGDEGLDSDGGGRDAAVCEGGVA